MKIPINPNQLEEFKQYVQRRYHSHFNDNFFNKIIATITSYKIVDHNQYQDKHECNR